MSSPQEAQKTTANPPAQDSSEGGAKAKKGKKLQVPHIKKDEFSYTYAYCEENTYKFLEKLTLMQVLDKAKQEKAGNTIPLKELSVASRFDKMYAVFLSSFEKRRALEAVNQWTSVVPLRVSSGDPKDDINRMLGKDCCVTWDYHCIALLRQNDGKGHYEWYIGDFDTKLKTYPEDNTSAERGKSLLIPAREYFSKAFNFMDLVNMVPSPTRMNPKKLQGALSSVKARLVPSDIFLTYFRTDRTHMKDKKGNYMEPPPSHPLIDAPSPITGKLRPAGAPVPDPYKPQLSNLIVSYVNLATQKDEEASLDQFLGEVVPIQELEDWLDTNTPKPDVKAA